VIRLLENIEPYLMSDKESKDKNDVEETNAGIRKKVTGKRSVSLEKKSEKLWKNL